MMASLAYILTFGRVVLAATFAGCVAWAARSAGAGPISLAAMLALLVLAAAAEATDLLDGYVARRTNSVSLLGGLADPLCDSLSRLTMYFAVALAGWVVLAVPLAMVGRDLVVAYVRTVSAHVGRPTSARPSGKAKAWAQGAGILAIVVLAGLAGPATRAGQSAADLPNAAQIGRWIVTAVVLAVTLWSLVDYLRGGWGAIRQLYRRRPAS